MLTKGTTIKALHVRIGDERWYAGHPLFRVISLSDDGLHIRARVLWYAFDAEDEAVWYRDADVPGMVRFKTVGITPVILTDETLPQYEPELASEVSRLKAWFTR